ncbi:helix-turn-helix domain-containing protein [Saccharolobus shibatae]|uniref:helix-turn-helix domain-containing protein n=1 Tax=Saccharolobus shibatae TaxID=2286 RepID=UPI001FD161CA|nr:helix-turn-helix domain-containing protein [Saccharolobus shibatae]
MDNNTVEEIAKKTGIREEAVYHLLEFLTIAGIVKKQENKYYIDETIRTIAQLMLDLDDLEFYSIKVLKNSN